MVNIFTNRKEWQRFTRDLPKATLRERQSEISNECKTLGDRAKQQNLAQAQAEACDSRAYREASAFGGSLPEAQADATRMPTIYEVKVRDK